MGKNPEIRIQKIKEFLQLFIPNKKKFHKKQKARENFDITGFSMIFGFNFENNDLYSDMKFNETALDIRKIKKHISLSDDSDSYFTPNLFLGNDYISKNLTGTSRKTSNKLCWLQDIYVDIDGTNGIKDPQKAKEKLYKALQKLGIPKPSALLKTSVSDDVHMQIHWLIDPVWLYDSREGNIDTAKLEKWYSNVAFALTEILENQLSDWEIDKAKTLDMTTYARLPYTYNQKTGDLVEILDINERKKRWTLNSKWIQNVVERYYHLETSRAYKVKVNKDIDLLKHSQIKALLEGVGEGLRNYSQYAIALACKHDGLEQQEAIKVLLKQNKKCDPPERISKVESVVRSVYRSEKGLSSKTLAWVVSQATGEEINPDPAIFMACKDHIDIEVAKNYNKGINISKQQTICRVITKVLQLVRSGATVLPGTKEIAQISNVKVNTLKKLWSSIINILKDIGLNLDKSAHYHHKYIVVDNAAELLHKGSSNVINLKLLKSILEQIKGEYSITEIVVQKSKEEINSFAKTVANSPP